LLAKYNLKLIISLMIHLRPFVSKLHRIVSASTAKKVLLKVQKSVRLVIFVRRRFRKWETVFSINRLRESRSKQLRLMWRFGDKFQGCHTHSHFYSGARLSFTRHISGFKFGKSREALRIVGILVSAGS